MSKRKIASGIVLDRSGSMTGIATATISGVNEWLGDQRRAEAQADADAMECTITQFASRVVRIDGPMPVTQIQDLTPISYAPSGNTALYDAIMASIRALETVDADAYLVLIVTDGEENASLEFKLDAVRAKITALEATGRWTFTYLGANADAWSVAGALGMQAGNAANYASTPTSAGAMYAASSNSARRWRSDVQSGRERAIAASGLMPDASEQEISAVLRSAPIVTNTNYAAEAQIANADLNPTTTTQSPNTPPPTGTVHTQTLEGTITPRGTRNP